MKKLRSAFRLSVDEYLEFCADRGKAPDKPFSGEIPLTIRPEIHRAATAAAQAEGKSLNQWLSETIEKSNGANRLNRLNCIYGLQFTVFSEVLDEAELLTRLVVK